MISARHLGLVAVLLLGPKVAGAPPGEPFLDGAVSLGERSSGRSQLDISGWAVSSCGEVDLTLVVDGAEYLSGHPFMAWPDVKERYPGLPGASLPGFAVRVNPFDFVVGRHEAVARARVPGCGLEKELGRFVFEVARPVPGWLAWPILLVTLGVVPVVLGLLVARLPQRPCSLGWLPWAAPALWLAGVLPVLLGPRVVPPSMAIGPGLFAPLASWDSNFYLQIARLGYDLSRPRDFAFFPLFPLVIRPLLALPLPAPLTVSLLNGGLFLALTALLRRVRPGADGAVLLFVLLPPAFFFSVVYTEALFVALAAAAVLALRSSQGRPGALPLAFGASFLAALCRVTGVALAFLAVDLARERRWVKALAAGAGPLAAVGLLMLTIQHRTGDPLFFLNVQRRFGRSPSFDPSVFVHVAWDTLQRAEADTLWGAGLLLAALAGAAGLCREGRWGEGLYSAAAVLMPLATVSLVSTNRYALAAFPAFLFLGSRVTGRRLFVILGLLLLLARLHAAFVFGRQGFAG